MELTPAVVERAVREYPTVQSLSAVEEQHIEMLPGTFASGDYGWRDAEWVVQWYYRRFLGAYPDEDRRAAEAAYDRNEYEAVHAAIADAVEAGDAATALESLTALHGVDVPVGSAFLQFVDPDAYVVVGEREWTTLRDAGALDDGYPDSPTVPEYGTYLGACRRVADRCDCDLWDLYRAMWVLGSE